MGIHFMLNNVLNPDSLNSDPEIFFVGFACGSGLYRYRKIFRGERKEEFHVLNRSLEGRRLLLELGRPFLRRFGQDSLYTVWYRTGTLPYKLNFCSHKNQSINFKNFKTFLDH